MPTRSLRQPLPAPLRAALVGLLPLALAGCEPPAPAAWAGYAEGEYVYLSPGIAGALKTIAVQRGAQVARDAELFTLDDEAERAARDEAAARLASAQALAADAGKGRRRDEIAVVRAQLQQARTQEQLALADVTRQEQLIARGFVSRARTEDARLALQQARRRVDELQAALRVAQLPARVDERAAAQAQAEAAREALRQQVWREEQTRRSAPADAQVADVFFRVGEWVQAGQPVLALLPPGNVKARFFVPEAELGALSIGDAVQISCDGCGAPIEARVSFVSTQLEYTPPVIYSNAQRARLVMMVEARPAPADGPRLKPGQPLDVRPVARAAR